MLGGKTFCVCNFTSAFYNRKSVLRRQFVAEAEYMKIVHWLECEVYEYVFFLPFFKCDGKGVLVIEKSMSTRRRCS